MDPSSQRALRILELAQVPGLAAPVYHIGLVARRITIADQQHRAFNLVWALLRERRLAEGQSIAVIGAGMAGVSSSIYARNLNLCVSTFDRCTEPMAMQAGSSRWIHPYIYDWPTGPYRRASTRDFPACNWTADSAGNVVAKLRAEWRAALQFPNLTWYPGTAIDKLDHADHEVHLTDKQNKRHGPFRAVILALGFGEEDEQHFTSPYWHNDDFHQQLREGGSVLVSGCGDGGLIDTTRLSLSDFRHDSLVNLAQMAASDRSTTLSLLQIERDSIRYPDGQPLTDAIAGLDFGPELANYIMEKRRPGVAVTLNSQLDGPLTRKACLLNRVVVAQLLKHKIVKHLRGTITIPKKTPEVPKHTILVDGEPYQFDQIVLRHGPKKAPISQLAELENRLDAARTFFRTYSAAVDEARSPAWSSSLPDSTTHGTDSTAFSETYLAAKLRYLAQKLQEDVRQRFTEDKIYGEVFVEAKDAIILVSADFASPASGERLVQVAIHNGEVAIQSGLLPALEPSALSEDLETTEIQARVSARIQEIVNHLTGSDS